MQYVSTEAAREMHAPSERGSAVMKGLARHLIGCLRLLTTFKRQHQPSGIQISQTVTTQDAGKQQEHKFSEHNPRRALHQDSVIHWVNDRTITTRKWVLRACRSAQLSDWNTVNVSRQENGAPSHRTLRCKQWHQFGTSTKIGKSETYGHDIPIVAPEGTWESLADPKGLREGKHRRERNVCQRRKWQQHGGVPTWSARWKSRKLEIAVKKKNGLDRIIEAEAHDTAWTALNRSRHSTTNDVSERSMAKTERLGKQHVVKGWKTHRVISGLNVESLRWSKCEEGTHQRRKVSELALSALTEPRLLYEKCVE